MNLVDDFDSFEKSLPMKRVGDTKEIGSFVRAIIENEINLEKATNASGSQNKSKINAIDKTLMLDSFCFNT